jgi:hypothetical protein
VETAKRTRTTNATTIPAATMAAMATNPRTKPTTRKPTTAAEIHRKLARSPTKTWKTPRGAKPTKTRQRMASSTNTKNARRIHGKFTNPRTAKHNMG